MKKERRKKKRKKKKKKRKKDIIIIINIHKECPVQFKVYDDDDNDEGGELGNVRRVQKSSPKKKKMNE